MIKGGNRIKVPLFKGDLGGSKIFDTDKRTFQTSSYAALSNKIAASTFTNFLNSQQSTVTRQTSTLLS